MFMIITCSGRHQRAVEPPFVTLGQVFSPHQPILVYALAGDLSIANRCATMAVASQLSYHGMWNCSTARVLRVLLTHIECGVVINQTETWPHSARTHALQHYACV